MKMMLILLACWCVAASLNAQTAVLESQKAAVAAFPALADTSSALSRAFLARVKALQVAQDPRLMGDGWPLAVAREVAAELGIEPRGAAAGAGGGYVNPLERVAGQMTVQGAVKQRTPDGLLVQTRMRGDDGLIFLRGVDLKEGERVSVPAIREGTYSYETVLGAAKVLDAYRALK